jgi:predicted hydrocarbon binding protein
VLEAELGAMEGARLAREIGFAQGSALHELFRDWLAAESQEPAAAELEMNVFWERVAEFAEELGLGRLQVDLSHPGMAMLVSNDWFEAERSGAEQPACHLTTGLLAAFLHEIAGQDLAVMEVECRASGVTNCTFAMGGESTLDALHLRMVAGEEFPGVLAALS